MITHDSGECPLVVEVDQTEGDNEEEEPHDGEEEAEEDGDNQEVEALVEPAASVAAAPMNQEMEGKLNPGFILIFCNCSGLMLLWMQSEKSMSVELVKLESRGGMTLLMLYWR